MCCSRVEGQTALSDRQVGRALCNAKQYSSKLAHLRCLFLGNASVGCGIHVRDKHSIGRSSSAQSCKVPRCSVQSTCYCPQALTCSAHKQLLLPPSFATQIGAYHTLDLELNQVFSIEKDVWDVIHLERIETSSDPAKKVCTASVNHASIPATTPLSYRQTCTAS